MYLCVCHLHFITTSGVSWMFFDFPACTCIYRTCVSNADSIFTGKKSHIFRYLPRFHITIHWILSLPYCAGGNSGNSIHLDSRLDKGSDDYQAEQTNHAADGQQLCATAELAHNTNHDGTERRRTGQIRDIDHDSFAPKRHFR